MRAEPLTIAQIFKNRVRYCVPMFQRHYVWNEEKQWLPFWEDLVEKAAERIENREKQYPHFMGAIVLESKGGYSTKRVQICNVIDGQQRLTTLQVFLAALRDVAKEKNLEGIARNTEQYLFNDDVNLMEEPETEIYKVWPTRFDRGVYSDVLSLKDIDEVRRKYKDHFPQDRRKMRLRRDKVRDIPLLLKAYMYFREQIVDYLKPNEEIQEGNLGPEEKLDQLYRAFLEGFKIVEIQLDEGDDPQVIFETLNDRGTPLLASDLIRNFIFYRAEVQAQNPIDLYNRHWAEFEKTFWSIEEKQGRLKKTRLEFFMQHFLAAKTGQEINLIKLFQEYKTYIQVKKPYESIEQELADIERYSPIYKTLVHPEGDDFLALFSRSLQPWDVSTVFPLVFQIMGSALEDVEKEGMLSDILSYIARRSICQKTPKNYNKLFLQIVRHLNKVGISRQALQQYLLSFKTETGVWPSDEELGMYWLNSPVYKYLPAPRICYVLKEIERGLQNKFSEEIEVKGYLTIEHVMPQAWEENWPLQTGEKVSASQTLQAALKVYDASSLFEMGLDSEGEKTLDDKINRRNRLMHTFGNLTLLTNALNGSVSKNAFEKKRPSIIEQSALALNRYFQNVDAWDEDKINERGASLLNVAKGIWTHPGDAKSEKEAA